MRFSSPPPSRQQPSSHRRPSPTRPTHGRTSTSTARARSRCAASPSSSNSEGVFTTWNYFDESGKLVLQRLHVEQAFTVTWSNPANGKSISSVLGGRSSTSGLRTEPRPRPSRAVSDSSSPGARARLRSRSAGSSSSSPPTGPKRCVRRRPGDLDITPELCAYLAWTATSSSDAGAVGLSLGRPQGYAVIGGSATNSAAKRGRPSPGLLVSQAPSRRAVRSRRTARREQHGRRRRWPSPARRDVLHQPASAKRAAAAASRGSVRSGAASSPSRPSSQLGRVEVDAARARTSPRRRAGGSRAAPACARRSSSRQRVASRGEAKLSPSPSAAASCAAAPRGAAT